jgi:phosphopantothenoylcysteine decarboxylase/phosphopantothenate--cysteine ligase
VLTRAAQEFVGAITFEAVTGRPVHTALLDAGHALDHIRLARAADAIVVAPATADFLARAAQGRADDLLTACLLAAGHAQGACTVVIAPAMNDRMWAHPATRDNVERLRALGYGVVEPATGPLAVGEGSGPGRLPEPEELLAHVGRALERPGALRGRHVVVTAGPTREAVDPVRYLSNRSSGRMGVAIAEAAWRRGAEVTLVAGPLAVQIPLQLRHVAVETTAQMRDAVARALPDADALVMAAAPADFGAAAPAASKIKKAAATRSLELSPTSDILVETRGARRPGAVIVGFALETDDVIANGRAKLDAKALDMIVVNDAHEPGAGFGVDTNRVTILSREGSGVREEALELMPKSDVADAILDRVEALLGGR